ncbi:hypothetical protein ATK74_1403 [Propionicimonas paludicola]|uniref:Uncharacterized protein n=2 Tax=Propionicimonas paludicola TaxID=185243 RepID=A0A2A9CR51_9ACTN|nr:hypothetical protein ATK74_1403 [Propionicimonas paludicola]
MERALAVARVFDEFPYLRPRRVGGDPARIKVTPSMEAVVEATGLPIDWLTVRRDEGDAMEFGEIDLSPGRGGWVGEQEDGEWAFSLTGHRIEQRWEADTVAESAAIAAVAAFFEGMVVAMDAAYGCVTPGLWRPRPLHTVVEAELPGVFWLNYFGPAFVGARPELATIVGARTLRTGGVLVQTSSEPWQPYEVGIPAWQSPLRAVFGAAVFEWVRPNPALPTIDEHVSASPGTQEMPWVAWQATKAANDRTRKHTAASKRLAAASLGRAQPTLPDDAVEWSTSFDLDDWREFARYLTRKLRGDLTTAIGKAVISVITTAPVDEEDSIILDTQLGPIRLGWFMDDEDVVDLYIWGPPLVSDLCDAWLA